MQTENKEIIKDLLSRNWNYVVLVLCIILFWHSCKGSAVPVVAKTIKTKEVKGKFEAVKPKQENVVKYVKGKTIYKTNAEDKFLQGQIDVLIAENKALQQFYNEASDSLKQALYNKAIEIKSFNQDFEDDKLKITTSGLVRGEIQSIKLDYTIKPQTIELPKQKETFLRLLAGGSFGINKELNQFTYSASTGLQNKKGNIIRGTYQRIGTNEYYLAGYEFSVFNWKR
jgi:hypothetical protein